MAIKKPSTEEERKFRDSLIETIEEYTHEKLRAVENDKIPAIVLSLSVATKSITMRDIRNDPAGAKYAAQNQAAGHDFFYLPKDPKKSYAVEAILFTLRRKFGYKSAKIIDIPQQ